MEGPEKNLEEALKLVKAGENAGLVANRLGIPFRVLRQKFVESGKMSFVQ